MIPSLGSFASEINSSSPTTHKINGFSYLNLSILYLKPTPKSKLLQTFNGCIILASECNKSPILERLSQMRKYFNFRHLPKRMTMEI